MTTLTPIRLALGAAALMLAAPASAAGIGGPLPFSASYICDSEKRSCLSSGYHDDARQRRVGEARRACIDGNFYRAMRCLKPCVEEERERANAV